MITIDESPLLTEAVNKKNYTDRVVQKAETIETKEETEKETETYQQKPIIPTATDEIKDEIKNAVNKPTFVADDDDGIMSFGIGKNEDDDDEKDEKDEKDDTSKTHEVDISEMADVFGEVVLEAAKEYVPKVFTSYAQLPKRKVRYIIEKYKERIPGEDKKTILEFFEAQNIEIDEALKITEKEAELLKKTFVEFLKYKNIQVATPDKAFYLQTGLIFMRLSITSMFLRKDLRSNFVDLMNTKFQIDIQKK